MLQKKKVDVDVIDDILKATLEALPDSTFVKSLSQQYHERGGLSKKQLQGLYFKAEKVQAIPDHKLTTLEAIIKKKPTKYKSALPAPAPLFVKDESIGNTINAILAKYPQHKRVLYFKARYDNNETLSALDITELQKFSKLLK